MKGSRVALGLVFASGLERALPLAWKEELHCSPSSSASGSTTLRPCALRPQLKRGPLSGAHRRVSMSEDQVTHMDCYRGSACYSRQTRNAVPTLTSSSTTLSRPAQRGTPVGALTCPSVPSRGA